MNPTRKGSRRRGSIEEKESGTFLVRVFLGRDATGKRHRVSQTVRGNRSDAQRALTELLGKQDQGIPLPSSRLTLGDWLEEFDRLWSADLGPQTRENAAQALRCYVNPAMRATRLAALRTVHFQELYRAMSQRGLSPSTIGNFHRIIRARLNKAVEVGHLARNPLDAAAPPAIRRREYRVLSPEEAAVFLEEVERDDLAALWKLLLMTGLRPGEALGLRWEDLDGDRLAVRRALVRLAGGRWSLEETKTRKGRTVTLPGTVVRALSRHRARQAERRLLLGTEYAAHGLIFTTTLGQPYRWDNAVRRHFAPALGRTALRLIGRRVLELPRKGVNRAARRSWTAKAARREARALELTGLAQMRPYDLRHSAATLLLAAGEHPKVVAELLGHAKVTLTLDTYSHVSPRLLAQAAERMEQLIQTSERLMGQRTAAP